MILKDVNKKELHVSTDEDVITEGRCIVGSIKTTKSIKAYSIKAESYIKADSIEADYLYNYAFQNIDLSSVRYPVITTNSLTERMLWLSVLKDIEGIDGLLVTIQQKCFDEIIAVLMGVQDILLTSNLPSCFKDVIKHYIKSRG